MHPYWPLFDLEIRTPTLILRYIDDGLAVRLCELMQHGIHEPEYMPFGIPWSVAPSPQREHDALRYYWRSRAETRPDAWHLPFAVQRDGEVVGAGSLAANDFAMLRTAETGSWLGQAFQGHGYGKEFRAALLHLAFDGLDAVECTTAAWSDNTRSLGVTRHWGYEPNGVIRGKQGDEVGELCKFRMGREHWETIRRDDIELVNLAPARTFLGL